MQALFESYVPLSAAQQRRLSQFCACVLLAGSSQLPALARWLGREAQQDNREQWLRRLLDAPYVSQQRVYQPWLRQALQGYHASCWHLVLDRTNLVPQAVDLVTVGLAYHKRAIPLHWQQIQYGGVSIQTYIELLTACKPLLPPQLPIVLHGDAEFGAIPMLHFAGNKTGILV